MSFESVNRPGSYLRHQNFVLHLQPDDGSSVFAVWRDQTTKESILGAVLADNAASLAAPGVVLYTDNGAREAPAVTWAGGTLLTTWIETNPQRVSGLRVKADASFAAIDAAPFAVSDAATFRVPAALNFVPDSMGASVSGAPLATPPAAVVSAATGETLAVYDPLDPVQVRP